MLPWSLMTDESRRAFEYPTLDSLGVRSGDPSQVWRSVSEEPHFGRLDEDEVDRDHAEQQQEELRG